MMFLDWFIATFANGAFCQITEKEYERYLRV